MCIRDRRGIGRSSRNLKIAAKNSKAPGVLNAERPEGSPPPELPNYRQNCAAKLSICKYISGKLIRRSTVTDSSRPSAKSRRGLRGSRRTTEIVAASNQRAGQQFRGMKDLASQSCQQLLMAGNSTRDQGSRSALLFGAPHLRKQVFADSHAQLVILALIPEAARHATAFHRGRHHIKTRCEQYVDGLRCGIARPLLAMRVVEEPRTLRASAGSEYLRQVELQLLRDSPQHFQRLKAVLRKQRLRARIVEQMLEVEAQHGQHAGFKHDDFPAFVQVPFKHRC